MGSPLAAFHHQQQAMSVSRMNVRSIEYRGYSMQLVHNPPQLQVEITPVSPGLPELPVEKQTVKGWNQDEVVKRAKARIDDFLVGRHTS
jgi:hypothetical protein